MLTDLIVRSLENPQTTLADPEPWLFDAWGGTPASSGFRVNRESALLHSAVWRACNLISGDVGKLPLHAYRRLADGGKERATTLPAYKLMRRKPYAPDYLTAHQFKKLLTFHALLTGNGYGFIEWGGSGVPLGVRPLSPEKVTPIRVNGMLYYKLTTDLGDSVLPPMDVLHIRGLAWDGISGYSVVAKARESLGLGLAQQKYAAIYFRNASRPSVVLEHPGKMSKEAQQRFKESWEDLQSGLDNAHRTAVLEEGMKATPLTINAKDSQLLESREFGVRDVANWFGVPSHKLGDTARTSYNSLEQENQSYLDQGLDHWLVAWEEEANVKLLNDRQRANDGVFFEFERNALVRADISTRFGAYNTALQGGWLSRNEIRERENLNPIEGGDEYYVPLNMGTNSQAAEEDEEEEEEEDDEDMRALYRDCADRYAKRLFSRALAICGKPEKFREFLGELPHLIMGGRETFEPAHRVARSLPSPKEAAWTVASAVHDALARIDLADGGCRAAIKQAALITTNDLAQEF